MWEYTPKLKLYLLGSQRNILYHRMRPYIAQCILPDIIALYESEEGQQEFQEWKTQYEAERTEEKVRQTKTEWNGEVLPWGDTSLL